MLATTNSPTQLVELRQSKAFGILNQDDRSIRHVYPHLNHRRTHQNIILARSKGAHDLILFLPAHASMQERQTQIGKDFTLQTLSFSDCRTGIYFLAFPHQGVHNKGLATCLCLMANKGVDPLTLTWPEPLGVNGLSSWR